MVLGFIVKLTLIINSFSQIDYSIRCMFPKWSDWNIQYTTKGLIKHRIAQTIKVIALAASIIAAWKIRHDFRGGLTAFLRMGNQYLKFGLLSLLMSVQRGVSRL